METDLKDKKYVAVMDLELLCADPPLPREDMEIIEIGIEGIDINTLETLFTISRTVKPVKNPILSNYCKNLTNITQEEVNKSSTLVETIKEIQQEYFYPPKYLINYTWGKNDPVFIELLKPEDFVWCCWGNDSVWLQKELERQGSDITFDKRFINLKLIDNRNGKRRGLKKALQANGIEQTQPAHRALADARSTANLARKYRISIEDVQVSNTRTLKEQITGQQKETIAKFSKRCNISIEASKYALKNFNWDFSKAKYLIDLLKKEKKI